MFLLSEFWFLVSTAILTFVIWRSRKKKLSQPDGNSLQSIKTHARFRAWFTSILFVGFWYFSIFSHFGSEISIIKEVEFEPVLSQAHSIISYKKFERMASRSYGLDQEISQILYLVLTNTEFSY